MVGPMTITAEQIAELLGRAEKHNTRSSMAGSATLIWDLAEAVKELVAERGKRVADSNEAQREIDDLTAQVEALASERGKLRRQLSAASEFSLGERITIQRRRQRDGTKKWSVNDSGCVLNSDGKWECEPSPSNRTDDFIATTRFTLEEAWEKAEAVQQTRQKK